MISVLIGRPGVLTPALILIGGFSLILTFTYINGVIRIKATKYLNLFIVGYIGFGFLFFSFFKDAHPDPVSFGLNLLLKTILVVFPLGGYFYYLAQKKGVDALVKTIFYWMLIGAISIVLFKQLGLSFEEIAFNYKNYNRYSGIWRNANVASFAICATLILLFYLRLSLLIKTIPFYLYFLLLAYSVFLTSSTTGFLILLAISVLFFYYKSISRSNKVLKVLFFSMGLLICLISVRSFLSSKLTGGDKEYQTVKVENMVAILGGDIDGIHLSERGEMFGQTMPMIMEHWVSGYGIGYFSKAMFANDQVLHNYFLVVWGESGIFGFATLLIFLWYFLKSYFRCKTVTVKFIHGATWVFFVLTFGSGGGLIGNYNMLIYFLAVAMIVEFKITQTNQALNQIK